MLLDAFLKLDGVTGGSTDALHAQEIEIFSFEQIIERTKPLTPTGSSGNGIARSEHRPLTIIKAVDRTSPLLFQASCAGTTYQTATISVCQPGGTSDDSDSSWKKLVYLQISLQQVHVSRTHLVGDPRVHVFGSSKFYPLVASEVAAVGPVEEIDLSYQVIQWQYNDESGTALTNGGWSLASNQAAGS